LDDADQHIPSNQQPQTDDMNNNEDECMVTEEELMTQIDHMVQELKVKKDNVIGSWNQMESLLCSPRSMPMNTNVGESDGNLSSSCSSKSSLSTTTSTLSSSLSSARHANKSLCQQQPIVLEEPIVKCLTDLSTALKKVTEITEGVARLPLNDSALS